MNFVFEREEQILRSVGRWWLSIWISYTFWRNRNYRSHIHLLGSWFYIVHIHVFKKLLSIQIKVENT